VRSELAGHGRVPGLICAPQRQSLPIARVGRESPS
jgi:hypothetical protein